MHRLRSILISTAIVAGIVSLTALSKPSPSIGLIDLPADGESKVPYPLVPEHAVVIIQGMARF